ncbi:hypothetical protein E4T56_gene2096, partial [Termitomyces sp. T112]
ARGGRGGCGLGAGLWAGSGGALVAFGTCRVWRLGRGGRRGALGAKGAVCRLGAARAGADDADHRGGGDQFHRHLSAALAGDLYAPVFGQICRMRGDIRDFLKRVALAYGLVVVLLFLTNAGAIAAGRFPDPDDALRL